MRKANIYTIVLTLLLVNTGFCQQNNQLLSSEIRDLLHESLSGELAKEHVIQITRHHRIQGSRGYRDAANYVLQQLRGFGYSEKDAYIESFKSDGKVKYQTWQSPSGWDIEWGWGYIDLDVALDQYDPVMIGSIGAYSDKWYSGTMSAGEKATIAWLKHPGQSLVDLDLFL